MSTTSKNEAAAPLPATAAAGADAVDAAVPAAAPDAGAAPGRELEKLVFEDDLTHLRNRRFLFKYLKEELAARDLNPGPLSLCLIDLDKFKEINDTHGHISGDNALLHVSDIFRESLPESGIPVRYAGDEFVLILPHAPKDDARRVAEEVLKKVKESDFRVGSGGAPTRLPLSLSIGVASYPEDAREGKPLIEAADRALYASKRAGRGRVTAAGSLPPEAMAGDRTLDGFPCPTLVGRRSEREQFAQILSLATGTGTSASLPAAVFVTGPAGGGKSRCLRSFFEAAEDRKMLAVLVKGIERDSLTPYAGAAGLLRALLASADPLAIIADAALSAAERSAVAALLPDLAAGAAAAASPDALALAAAFPKIVRAVAGKRAVALFVDDIQWLDVSSLDVLFAGARAEGTPLVLAATIREGLGGLPPGVDPRRDRIEALLREGARGGPTRLRIDLPPLAKPEVVSMIRAIFGGLEVPDETAELVASASRGNPLFVEEILKGLVNKGRIARGKKGFVIGPVGPEDIPANLDEALRSRFRAVDKETDAVLTNAAAIGPEFALKLIQDLTGKREAEVLELLDRAAAARLLRYVGDASADRLEFAAPRLQELKRDATPEGDARSIHERIAAIEESENRDGALRLVLGRLAFHHARAGNSERADEWLARIGDVAGSEAADAGRTALFQPYRHARRRIAAADSALTEREISLVGDVVRLLAAAIKGRLMYPKGSKLVASAFSDLSNALARVFHSVRVFTVSTSEKDLFLNGNKVDHRRCTVGVYEFLDLLKRFDIKSVTMTKDVAMAEVEAFVDALCADRPFPLPADFWDRKLDAASVKNLAIDQRVYVLAGSDAAMAPPRPSPAAPKVGGEAAAPSPLADRAEIDAEFRASLPALLEKFVRERKDGEISETISRVLAALSAASAAERRDGAKLLRDLHAKLGGDSRLAVVSRTAPAIRSRIAAEEDPEALRELLRLGATAIRASLERGDFETATGLIQAIADRRNGFSPEVEREATRVLKDLLDSSAFELLLSDLGSGVADRHDRAFRALQAFGPIAVGAILRVLRERDDYRLRKTGAGVLRAFGAEAAEGVRRALGGAMPDVEYRRLISVIDDIPGDFGPEIERAFRHPNRGVRNEAVTVLNRLRTDILQIFLTTLTSPDPQVAAEAARELGKRGRSESVAPLLRRLKSEDDPELKAEIVLALGRIGDARAEDALVEIATQRKLLIFGPLHPDRMRAAAAWALSRLDTKKAKAACQALARDRSPQVRAMLASHAPPELRVEADGGSGEGAPDDAASPPLESAAASPPAATEPR